MTSSTYLIGRARALRVLILGQHRTFDVDKVLIAETKYFSSTGADDTTLSNDDPIEREQNIHRPQS
jgi:hypothetical protein